MNQSASDKIQIERFQLSIFEPFLDLQPRASDLVSRMVELEISSGLSSRGIDSYLSIASQPAHLILLARRGKELSGLVGVLAACIVLDELQIDNLAVHPDFRGLGIGTRLVSTGLDLARQEGCGIAILEVRSSNGPARNLYRKAGFEEAGKRPGYYQNPPDDAITMLCQF